MANTGNIFEGLEIYKAAISGDWETAKGLFANRSENLNMCLTPEMETPLHVAVGTNSSHRFVEELVELIMRVGDQQMLRSTNSSGDTALHFAATAGNVTAARLLVEKDPELSQIVNVSGSTALMLAALLGCKEALCYLLTVTKDVVGEDGTSPYRGQYGAHLLTLTILDDCYDVALYLVDKYPGLVTEKDILRRTGLQLLAVKSDAFPSGSKLGFWQSIIYSYVRVNREKALESPVVIPSKVFTAKTPSKDAHILHLIPQIKQIYDIKVKHIQAEELVRRMCSIVINKGDHDIAWGVFGEALVPAIKSGNYELMEQCLHYYPSINWYNLGGYHFLLVAIKERQDKIYNLVYQMSQHKAYAAHNSVGRENALHLAGKLAPLHRLNTVTGAALQMQRELQWFKEVEKFVKPSYKINFNDDKMTPRMVFTDKHKELVKEAQQWMKDTSSSATVVAALIVTMAFAAIYTVPGGNNDSGKPLFLDKGAFILFAISDAVALFSSSTSVLMFLSILNSRFAEEDFLYALPKRLTLGLISLFISLAATMVAFSATLSLVLRDKIQWIAAPVILLASVPVTLFLLLQSPLLVELIRSTYGRGIFYKQNDLMLH